ncbi:MAG TPA: heparan-alpha-glucosaminide N-acetyltransferase domain-containing protein [Steroidobacteraceae bacterium]|nr:heparan-alpha-glucosaminide N-acetyltransferase domain-containing protein [Steroidobacteraceae bacterium]
MSQPVPTSGTGSHRIAAIDWMRGFVMILMIFDHASMSFDRNHLDDDSALYANAMTMALPAGEFFTRWMTHICAPTFVFLAGTALALSIGRRLARGSSERDIDRELLTRGAIIAMLDPTLISLGLGHLSLSVLFAIGVSMMCMTVVRRLPDAGLLAFGLGWFLVGEWITALVWSPPGAASIPASLAVATSGGGAFSIKYPVVPWLAIMSLGWVFGRHMTRFANGSARRTPAQVMFVAGLAALAVFAAARGLNGYGNMFLLRADDSWQQWLHVSKYPPSLTFASLELGLMALGLSAMLSLEPLIGVRKNGPLLVLGQTAMFYYLVHRFVFDATAFYGGLLGIGTISTTYIVGILMLVALYPLCRWYRGFKAAHPRSFLRYL